MQAIFTFALPIINQQQSHDQLSVFVVGSLRPLLWQSAPPGGSPELIACLHRFELRLQAWHSLKALQHRLLMILVVVDHLSTDRDYLGTSLATRVLLGANILPRRNDSGAIYAASHRYPESQLLHYTLIKHTTIPPR